MITPLTNSAYKVKLLPVLGKGLRAVWDNLGIAVAWSITFCLILLLPVGILKLVPISLNPILRYSIFTLVGGLVLSPLIAGGSDAVRRRLNGELVGYQTLFTSAKALFQPALKLGIIHAIASVVFPTALFVYSQSQSKLMLFATIPAFYIACLWVMMGQFQFALLSAQEAGVFDDLDRKAQRGSIAVLRRSLFIVMGKPFFCGGLLLITLVIASALVLSGVGLVLGLFPVFLFLSETSTRELLMEFGIIEAPLTEENDPGIVFETKEISAN